MFTKKLKLTTETIEINNDLVTDAKIMPRVTSAAERGLPIKSIILPITFPIKIDDEECENACWITCIEISPGAKNSMNGKPKTSPLSLPQAMDNTIKNRIPTRTGPIIV